MHDIKNSDKNRPVDVLIAMSIFPNANVSTTPLDDINPGKSYEELEKEGELISKTRKTINDIHGIAPYIVP